MSASKFKQEHLMDMNKKEIWVDKVMNSIEKIEEVQVSNELAVKLDRISGSGKRKIIEIQPKARWAIAAAIATLMLINVYAVKRTVKRGSSGRSIFATEYFSYMNSI